MAPRVVTTATSWVEPAGPVVPKTYVCSPIENQCSQVYPSVTQWFANKSDTKDPLTQFAMLKRAMARVLYEQPLLGGTLLQDDRGAYSVEIPPAPRAGAKFYYSDMRNDKSFPTFAEMQRLDFPFIDAKQDGLFALSPEDHPTSVDGDGVFFAQFTVLRGGTVVSTSWTHQVGDLVQPRTCVVSLARETKLLAEAEAAGLPEPPLPAVYGNERYDRTPLIPHVPHLMSFEEVNEICERRGDVFVFDPTSPERTAELMMNVFPRAHLRAGEEQNEDHLRTELGSYVHFPLKSLQRLQAIAQAGAAPGIKLSTVNVIIAFIWQRFYMARNAIDSTLEAASDEIKQLCTKPAMIFPGDIRGRWKDTLPPSFLGAAVDMFKAELELADFIPENLSEAAMSRSLGAAATAVRKSNESFSLDSHKELLKLFSSTPVSVPFLPKGPIDFLVTDHTRNTPFIADSYGPGMGAPTELRQPYLARDMPQGEVTIMPRRPNGDIQIMLSAERITMQRLFQDKTLLEFAQPLFMAYNVPEALAAEKAAACTPTARL